MRFNWTRTGLRVLLATLWLCALKLQAQTIYDTPALNPSAPASGQPISVELHGNPCVLYIYDPPNETGVVSRNGSSITLTVQAVVSPDFDFCIYPTFTVPYPIGAYTPGNYTVQVDAQYEEFLGGTVTQTLGTLPFVVAAPRPVPTLSGLMLALLTLLMGVAVRMLAGRGGLVLSKAEK
jgi:hypothetical protein